MKQFTSHVQWINQIYNLSDGAILWRLLHGSHQNVSNLKEKTSDGHHHYDQTADFNRMRAHADNMWNHTPAHVAGHSVRMSQSLQHLLLPKAVRKVRIDVMCCFCGPDHFLILVIITIILQGRRNNILYLEFGVCTSSFISIVVVEPRSKFCLNDSRRNTLQKGMHHHI